MDDHSLSTGFIADVITVMVVVQAVLWGLARGLERVMDKTTTQLDNKAFVWISKILTLIDMVTGNREHQSHKPPLERNK